jgi:aminoglycoside phosphotransferase (APT) family kinase protein
MPDLSIDISALERWLADRLGDAAPMQVERMGQETGVGNALYDVRRGDRRMVLRRPPAVKVTASAGNTLREARVLGALAGTDVPHPRLVAVCEDPEVIGASFLLMEHVDGFTAVDPLPDGVDDPAAKRALGIEIVEGLARLALVDWQAVGLDGFGKPDGFLARQVDRWLWQLDSYRTRDLPNLDDVTDWLRRNLPEPGPIGIVHGDYSMYNTMFSHDRPPRLAAIIDWDTATIGETLVDLGHLLSRWDEPGEAPTSLGSNDMADRTGLPRRHELAERYAHITGHDLSNVLYYEVLSLFKLGCIMEGHHANAISAAAGGDVDPRFVESAPNLLADAARIAQGGRGEI